MQNIEIITPRLSILCLHEQLQKKMMSHEELLDVCQELQHRHAKYLQVFNLTTKNLEFLTPMHIFSTTFKWRGIPYSLTQTIKILSALDAYLRCNIANSVIFLAPTLEVANFCKFTIQCYCQLLQTHFSKISLVPTNLLNLTKKDNILSEFLQIYHNCRMTNPPVKIIESVEFYSQSKEEPFIPIFQICNEFRHNGFETIYQHSIQQTLSQYYLQLKSPLKTGIGAKYCEKKPETKYLFRPCLVSGDVRINFYSFQKIVPVHRFVVGFNTKGLEYEQTTVVISSDDWYFEQQEQKVKFGDISIKITMADYCPECLTESKCDNCLEKTKKIYSRYSQSQIQLQKLKRSRLQQQVKRLLSLQ